MKNSEKNSSKVNNTTNNDVFSPKTIKLQLQAACANMDAAQTKEYIKGLAGYSIKQTGANPDRTHSTIYYGEVRICNVENVQGITKDGTARGCISVAKVNFLDAAIKLFENKTDKLKQDLTGPEVEALNIFFDDYNKACEEIQNILDNVNNRIAEKAKEAAAAKRAEAAKERAQKKVGEKIAAGTDSEKIAAIAAALNVSYDVAAKIYKDQKQTA